MFFPKAGMAFYIMYARYLKNGKGVGHHAYYNQWKKY